MEKEYYLITGASGGIGSATAKMLLAENKSVIVTSSSAENLQQCFAGHDAAFCRILPWDLTATDSIKEYMQQVKAIGPLRGFVHCAGFDKMAAISQNKAEDINRLLAIHAVAPLLICGQLAKKHYHTENCSIVLVSSLSTHEGAAGHTAYAAAKGAVEGFLKAAASELADKAIRLNLICPGVVETKMSAGWMDRLDAVQMENLHKQYPFGLGKSEDICELIGFLLSNKSKWITGQNIIIDGGRMCNI